MGEEGPAVTQDIFNWTSGSVRWLERPQRRQDTKTMNDAMRRYLPCMSRTRWSLKRHLALRRSRQSKPRLAQRCASSASTQKFSQTKKQRRLAHLRCRKIWRCTGLGSTPRVFSGAPIDHTARADGRPRARGGRGSPSLMRIERMAERMRRNLTAMRWF